jgi:tetratricopeptide (TPR) repeat protein
MIGHAPDAHYLARLLKSMVGVIDHLCFVNTDTSDECLKVIEGSGISFDYEIHAFDDRSHFDFSLVRNKARRMAEKIGGWAFWLDCDDMIERPERIRKQIAKTDAEAFAMPYKVGPAVSNLFKIRIHRAGEWRWVNPVHEELMPIDRRDEKREVTLFREIEVVHSPDEGKSNHEFHIDLLKQSIKTAPADYCYLAKEHFNKCDFEGAVPWIKKALAVHDVSIEIYNLWLLLAISHGKLDDDEKMIDALHSAIKERPHRREAYYYLAEYYGKKGGNLIEKGFAYIKACNAQEDKREPLQHSAVYQINGHKLHARYLQTVKDFRAAIEMAQQIESPDKETEQILDECFASIEQGSIDDGSSKFRDPARL